MTNNVQRFPSALNNKWHTAIHEAGHAVVGRVLTMKCGGASIEQDHDSAGHSITHDHHVTQLAWEDQYKFRDYDKSVWVGRILAVMAGAEAEVEFFGRCEEESDKDDRYQIALMFEKLTISDIANYEARLRAKARACVKRHRDLVKHLADVLIAKGSISSEEIDGLVFTGSRLELAERLRRVREQNHCSWLASELAKKRRESVI